MGHLGRVGTAVASSGVSSLAITLTDGVPVGATVLIGCVWESAAASVPTVSSVTDSSGNSYSTTPDVSAGGPLNSTVAAAVLRGVVTSALDPGDTITVTISGGTRSRWCLQADAFDDLTSSPLDETATTGNSSPSGATPATGTTGETAQPYELLYAVFGFGGGRTVDDIPDGWTGDSKLESAAGSGNRAMQVIHRYVSVVDEYEATITLSSSSTYAAAMATYTAESGDPPVVDVTRLQMRLPLPPEGPAPVVDVTGLRMELPAGQGTAGEVHVSRLRMRLPAAPGQAPYSGIKARTAGGNLRDVAVYVAE